MGERGEDMVAFLGIAPDERLLDEDLSNLPDAERHHEPAISTQEHDRLVAAGSLLTGGTLIAGLAMMLYGALQLLFSNGGALAAVIAVTGAVLAGTHWGWVHVAEYAGLGIDERRQRALGERRQDWLAGVQPYPLFSVRTSVLGDASTRIERILHRPVLTAQRTFTFISETEAEKTYDARVPAEVIAGTVETMRRQARLETDRMRGLWEAASTTYAAALLSARDDQQRLAARRAAATALSEHLNASLLDPPLIE